MAYLTMTLSVFGALRSKTQIFQPLEWEEKMHVDFGFS